MSIARAERLVNLVLCLLSTRQYLTADRIRTIVPGYPEDANPDAFYRMFERDKAELRDLGIPLETGRNNPFDAAEGYRIARRDYELGDIDLEPDEAAAVALAVRLWDSPELNGAAEMALLKLRAAGVDVDQAAPGVLQRVVEVRQVGAQLVDARAVALGNLLHLLFGDVQMESVPADLRHVGPRDEHCPAAQQVPFAQQHRHHRLVRAAR